MTIDNASDITAAIIDTTASDISGKITYNDSTNTLTLQDAKFTTDRICIDNSIDGLKIELEGENDLESTLGQCVNSLKDFSISGKGTLNAIGVYAGIHAEQCNLTIDNTTVTAKGMNGIVGLNHDLTIKSSYVKAEGTSDKSIGEFNGIFLDDCNITSPSGAILVDKRIVDSDGNGITGKQVVIEPGPTSVPFVSTSGESIHARDGHIFCDEEARIYDMLGRDVTHGNGNLKGVYMVKSRNSVTKWWLNSPHHHLRCSGKTD